MWHIHCLIIGGIHIENLLEKYLEVNRQNNY